MAAILLEVPGRSPRSVKLVRPLTTIGSGEETDVRLEGVDLEAAHVQISRERDGFVVTGLTRDLTVNGRRERRRPLRNKDVLRFGQVSCVFLESDDDLLRLEPARFPSQSPGAPLSATAEVISAYRRLHEFAVRLLANESTEALVESLLDGIIALTGAEKGFLVLLDEVGRPAVRAARNVDRQRIEGSVEGLSDSILRKVVESKRPLILANALLDAEFNASTSIAVLGVVSVMCCPIMDRDTLRGVLYVGNDRAANTFTESSLDLMTVFAAEASLLLSQARRIEGLSLAKQDLERRLSLLKQGRLMGAADSMQEVVKRIARVAPTDVPVLITGETGTGKEVVAQEIHRASRRAKGPLVVVNCGAIPEQLLESELFGHVKGAFTGAVSNKEGRFQAANGGTLFLDEIGELPLPLQVKLLRALQDHVISRVGDARDLPVDIRVLAATHRVLEREIGCGRFREDLYYRLNVVSIALPPLRDRGDDIILLAKHFLAEASAEHGRSLPGFSKTGLNALRSHRWPGNVRELQNRIQKAVVLSDGPLVTAEDLDLRPEDLAEIVPLAEAKERFQTRYIRRVLEMNGGNRTKTARDLGVDPRTIFRHLERTEALGTEQDSAVDDPDVAVTKAAPAIGVHESAVHTHEDGE